MNGKALMFGIVLLALGLAGGYYIGTTYKLVPQEAATTEITPTVTEETTPVVTVTEATGTATPTLSAGSGQAADEKAAVTAAVKAGLVAEHGQSASSMNVTVSKIVGNFAQGGAVDPASVGGAMWLAAKTGSGWKLVWDGNGTISCEKIEPYNFPVSMLPECWNEATGKLITR